MLIEQKGSNEVVVTGNIKTDEDSLKIKDALNKLLAQGNRAIHLKIKDSLSMTSTTIGFLMKLVHQDNVQLSISVGDSRLYTLMEELSLLQQFNVRLAG
jgi:hypothetical protein